MSSFHSDDDHFRHFASALESEIAKYGYDEDEFQTKQKEQLEGLIALESEFRKTLIAHRWGSGVYRSFVEFICDERKNILAARPYFRERQGTFTKDISKVLKNRKPEALYRFAFNYRFVLYVMSARKWSKNSRIRQLSEQIRDLRKELVELNMPLAISRARVFLSRTQKAHLTYMDLIQIACEGLMSGIDKYTPGDAGVVPRVFRSTAMGRMGGNFIEEYSETLVHFFPTDKRKIYRANKLVGKFAENVDFDKLATGVNEGVKGSYKTSPSEIADLLSASSCLSLDVQLTTTESSDAPEHVSSGSNWAVAPEEQRPDVQAETRDAMLLMSGALGKLTVFEVKLLRLKGVSI